MEIDFDYSVHFANIRRVINNIGEPWKTELTEVAIALQEQIQENSQKMRKNLEVVMPESDMPPYYPFENNAYLCADYEGMDRI